MFFFQKPILTRKRRKALDKFRGAAIAALHDLASAEKDESTAALYLKMAHNVDVTPIYFYPRKSLREAIFRTEGRILGAVTKGESVNVIKIYQKGKQRFVVQSRYINLPAEHVFEEDKLTIPGIFTLSHEYAHFPKHAIGKFASVQNMSVRQAEELLADVLSAKLAVKLGYAKDKVLKHFRGRGLVYGSVPFRKHIMKAIS